MNNKINGLKSVVAVSTIAMLIGCEGMQASKSNVSNSASLTSSYNANANINPELPTNPEAPKALAPPAEGTMVIDTIRGCRAKPAPALEKVSSGQVNLIETTAISPKLRILEITDKSLFIDLHQQLLVQNDLLINDSAKTFALKQIKDLNAKLAKTYNVLYEKAYAADANGNFTQLKLETRKESVPFNVTKKATEIESSGGYVVALLIESDTMVLYGSSLGTIHSRGAAALQTSALAQTVNANQSYRLQMNVMIRSGLVEGTPSSKSQLPAEGMKQETDKKMEDCDNKYASPLVINFGTKDFKVTAPKVRFDIEANGQKPQIGWVSGAQTQGFLVRDIAKNGQKNGLIDDGSELFGNATELLGGMRATNGFEALRSHDFAFRGGNEDGIIDSNDRVFEELKIWVDKNEDGVSSASELFSLKEAGIVSIDTRFTMTNENIDFGNKIFGRSAGSKVKTATGATFEMADIWFIKK